MSCSTLLRQWNVKGFLLLASLGLVLALGTAAVAQLNEHCTVSVLNRTVQVKPDGTWVLPNIPANFGQVRARATCVENGITRSGQSELFSIPANGAVNLPEIFIGAVEQIPSPLILSGPTDPLTPAGATAQLTVTAKFPDGSMKNVTAASAGTSYTNSNPKVATVSSGGLVTAVSSGTVIISALNEGALGLIRIQVALSGGDTDGDGIPDDIETQKGLNPNDPTDGFADLDGDGLTNKQELVDFGTRIDLADTDGDSLSDGEEVKPGADGFVTNPLLGDTDGDGVSDSAEIAGGSDPTNPNSRPPITGLEVSPAAFVLTVNTIIGEASQQLTVTGRRADGGTVDLTDDPGTNYTSSDLSICNFGAERGRVFAVSDGTCTITVTNSSLSAQALGTIKTFAPVALSAITIPGYANNVDVNGNFAYVAAGSAGLQVVGVSNPQAPQIVGAQDTPGNADDVRVVGNLAFVADDAAGLQIFNISDPTKPVIVGSIDTPGEALDIMVAGNRVYVADGTAGLQIVDISNPSGPTILGAVDTQGIARGVDVSGSIAVIADDSRGAENVVSSAVRIIDVTNPNTPKVVGNINIPGEAKDLAVRGTTAYVVAFDGGFIAVDFATPTSPQIVGSLPGSAPTGFVPRDVELSGQFALAAEQLFPNVVPIVDISNPAAPIFRATIDFSSLGDYAGTGIALSKEFVYMTGEAFIVEPENGATGDTRLFIGQYLVREDKAGIAPHVTISSPAAGEIVIEGSTLPITVNASDDVAVDAVEFLVGGQVVFTDSTAPYQFNFTVPVGVLTLTLGARAVDLGNNVGIAPDVTVKVIPDPLTTVVGVVVDPNGVPVQGASITTVGGLSAITDTNGSFSILQVPTILGSIIVDVAFNPGGGVPLFGHSEPIFPVRGGTTNVGTVHLIPGFPNGNGGFEKEDFTGYTVSGDTSIITALGPLTPPEGNLMAFLSTSDAAVGGSTSTITTAPFVIPAGVKFLVFDVNFLSDEFPDYVGSEFNDTLVAGLTASGEGKQEVLIGSVNTAPFINAPAGTGFNGMTGFKTVKLDVSSYAGDATPRTLSLDIRVSDVGDTDVDSAALIDNLRFE